MTMVNMSHFVLVHSLSLSEEVKQFFIGSEYFKGIVYYLGNISYASHLEVSLTFVRGTRTETTFWAIVMSLSSFAGGLKCFSNYSCEKSYHRYFNPLFKNYLSGVINKTFHEAKLSLRFTNHKLFRACVKGNFYPVGHLYAHLSVHLLIRGEVH